MNTDQIAVTEQEEEAFEAMSKTEVFKRWKSERMGHPFPILLASDAVKELESAIEQLEKDRAELVELLKRLTNPDNCKKDIIHIIGNAESLLERMK